MKKFNDSENRKSTENDTQQEKKVCFDRHEELSNICSQVQMISDSLAACSKMSKYRPHRKAVKINNKASSLLPQAPQSSVHALPSTSENIFDERSSERGENIISYIAIVDKKEEKPHERTSSSKEQIISKSNSCEGLSRIAVKLHQKNLDSVNEDFSKSKKNISLVRMYEPGNVIPERMIDVIQREIKTLMELCPSLAYLLVTMSDTMFHYKACSKCRNKIYPAFPWVLNRLQKLIKFIVIKRHGTYIWPNDYSYLRLVTNEPTVNEPKDKGDLERENIESLLGQKNDSSPEEQKIQLRNLEKVDPLVVTGSLPGVQLFLKVESKQTKKRFFRKVSLKFREKLRGEFPIVQLQEISQIPVILILRRSSDLQIDLKEKRALSTPKLISHRTLLKFKLPSLVQKLISAPASWGRKHIVKRNKYKKNIFLLQRLKFFEQTGNVKEKSNDKVSYFTKNILINFSALVFDLITEGEEEKMQMQKVRELEGEVKELKNLMLDVRRNQAELSKILLKKGISSSPLLRFTSLELLQEEDCIVNRLEEIQLLKTRIEFLEALQKTVSDLKRKCTLKNRMILTLLRGFESNIPTEWWNEIMNLMFGETVEEDLNCEIVNGLVQKASFFFGNGEQGSKTFLPLTRIDEGPSKEEPIMKGNMGADVQENLKILSDLDDKWAKIKNETLLPLDCQIPMVIFTYPAAVQEHLGSTVRRLEYQVSILNVENERLWHEILDLKDILKSSVKGLSQKISHGKSDKQLTQIQTLKPSGKIVSITIQIASEKNHQPNANSETPKAIKVNENSKRSANRASEISTLTTSLTDSFLSNLPEKLFNENTIQDEKVTVLAKGSKLPVRSKRRNSINDFNLLDDLTSSPGISNIQENEEKVKAILRGRASSPLMERVIADSERGLWKTVQPVPSMHMVNEATFNYLAGPSWRRLNEEDNFQNSLEIDLADDQSDDLLVSVSKERELRPIPEDEDDSECRPSENVNAAIQHLRGRVRSIHKDVKVLKSKNDRIDKVLNKLVDDIKNNNENFGKIQKTLDLKR